jgi:hypothetical protein
MCHVPAVNDRKNTLMLLTFSKFHRHYATLSPTAVNIRNKLVADNKLEHTHAHPSCPIVRCKPAPRKSNYLSALQSTEWETDGNAFDELRPLRVHTLSRLDISTQCATSRDNQARGKRNNENLIVSPGDLSP